MATTQRSTQKCLCVLEKYVTFVTGIPALPRASYVVFTRSAFALGRPYVFNCMKSDAVGGLVTILQAGQPRTHGSISRRRRGFFLPPQRRNRLWSPLSLLFSGGDGGLKLTTHLHVVPRLRMSGSIPHLPHIFSWRTQIK